MAEQLNSNNTKQRLLGGRPQAAPRQAPRRSEDVFVANVGEKRYLWTARAFAIIMAISVCCNIVLILAIMQVMPLYRVEPFLLTFQNKQEQVYKIQPIQGNMEDQKAITEVFVRQYVLLRSALQEMSSSAVYSEFLEKTAKRALQIIRQRNLMRDVKILSVNELSRGLWQVEYETRDMYPDSARPEVNFWTASMRIAYRQKNVKYGERLKNPVGFTVTRYSLTYNKVE